MATRYDPTQYERHRQHVDIHPRHCCPNCHRDESHSTVDEDEWYVCRCGCEWAPDYRPMCERFDD